MGEHDKPDYEAAMRHANTIIDDCEGERLNDEGRRDLNLARAFIEQGKRLSDYENTQAIREQRVKQAESAYTSLRSRVDRVVGEMREEAFDKRGDCLMSIEGDVVLAWADQLMEGDK